MATGRIGTTPVLQVRWSKAPTNGTTSLSGLDDNSVSLVYSVGYEAVYRNGVLLSRGNDYTATNGTTVTLIDATITGDIIEIFANQTVPLSDTFSQTVADGRFIKNTLTTTTGDIIYASAANTPARLGIGSTDQVLKVSGGVPAWGAAPAASFVGCVLTSSTDQIITNNTDTAVLWESEAIDTDGFHSIVTNTNRITIPAGKAGKYLFTSVLSFKTNGTGVRQSYIRKNGNIVYQGFSSPNASSYTSMHMNTVLSLTVGDWVDFAVNQNSGGDLDLEQQGLYSNCSATYLGA